MDGISSLQAFRKEHGLSLQQLAAQIGVAGATLSRWETRKRPPQLALLKRIQEVTGISPSALRPDLAATFSEGAPPL